MSINKIYPDTAAMGIARELLAHSDAFEVKAKQLAEKHATEVDALNQELKKAYDEDFERLRLSLNIPNKLINPRFDCDYLEEFGELYLHHGPEIREASPAETLFAKLFGGRHPAQ